MARTQKKSPVQLRHKKLKNGNESLYLDIYYNGRRSYEYLNLYLAPATTEEQKAINKTNLQLAERIRATRTIELSQMIADCQDNIVDKMKHNNMTVVQFIEEYGSVKSQFQLYAKIRRFFPDLKIQDFTKKFITADLVRFLDGQKLTDTTRKTIFSIAKTVYNKAVEQNILPHQLIKNPYKRDTKERTYLTRDEVSQLKNVSDLKDVEAIVLNAFLFSCYTGLRYSDICQLRWCNIAKFGDYTRITFTQKKTKGREYLDISSHAVKCLGERKGDNELAFDDFVKLDLRKVENKLRAVAKRAKISKYLSFHAGRHTFAVMMLDLGVDLYTTSKLLGHTNVQTTQVYATILDKNKQKAVDLIPEF